MQHPYITEQDVTSGEDFVCLASTLPLFSDDFLFTPPILFDLSGREGDQD